MGLIPVLCPYCQSDQVIKGGATKAGKPRYRCQNTDCSHYSFILHPAYQAHRPEGSCIGILRIIPLAGGVPGING